MWRLTLLCDVCGNEFGTDSPSAPFSGEGQFARESYRIDSDVIRQQALRDGWKVVNRKFHCKACVRVLEQWDRIPKNPAPLSGPA